MFAVLELFLLSISFFICHRIWLAKGSSVYIYTAAYGATVLFCWLAYFVCNPVISLIDNLLLRFTAFIFIFSALSIVSFIKIKKFICEKWCPRFLLKQTVIFKSFIIFIYTGLLFLFILSLITVLSANEKYEYDIKEKSLFCRFFLQSDYPHENKSSWENLKTGIAGVSGSSGLRNNIAALNFLLTLEMNEYEYLINYDNDLAQILKNDQLKDIVKDPNLMRLFMKNEFGVKELYQIAEHKKIKDLLEDEIFLEEIRTIDLVRLKKVVEEYRKISRQNLKSVWLTSVIQSSLELDQCIKNGVWLRSSEDSSQTVNGWRLFKTETGKGSFELVCRTETKPVVIHQEESIPVAQTGKVYRIIFENGAPGEIIVMLKSAEAGLYKNLQLYKIKN